MQLKFLELAIGGPCPIDLDYPFSLVLHDSCLYKNTRKKLDILHPKSWRIYAEFFDNQNVLAVSLHPPLRRNCTKQELEKALSKLEATLSIPVYVEVMPSQEYWCSSRETLVDSPLLDVSHVHIWCRGDRALTQQTCLSLLNSFPVGAIHLSHNQGLADTHDLIPSDVWFADFVKRWSLERFVTYEMPTKYSSYERLDKRRSRR